jgi:hypothetical protein
MPNRKPTLSRWGGRRPTRTAAQVFALAEAALAQLTADKPSICGGPAEICQRYLEPSRAYYALAAFSRRKGIEESQRLDALDRVFGIRALLERRMLESLLLAEPRAATLKHCAKPSFFGKSIKQGVSVRYPLVTCMPTQLCGGRCYAHDGRDRDLQRLFRGVQNYFVGLMFERGDEQVRQEVMTALSRGIDEAIAAARAECQASVESGFTRSPRIRFSHVGEMAATPAFTNRLAQVIRMRAPDLACIIYSRHANAARLDPATFIVNFTVDGATDPRLRFRPAGARLVSSSWDGQVLPDADVNFLEHHVEKATAPMRSGNCCPVTLDHANTPSCDSAHCDRCFVPYPVELRVMGELATNTTATRTLAVAANIDSAECT